MTLNGTTWLELSTITGNTSTTLDQFPYEDIIMTVGGGIDPGYVYSPNNGLNPSALAQFLARYSTFKNSDPNATSIVELSTEFGGVQVTNSSADDVMFHGVDFGNLTQDDADGWIYIDNTTFSDIRDKAIFIENLGNPQNSTYGQININGNYFESFAPQASNIGSIAGICLKNFDMPNTVGSWTPYVVVNNNQFTHSGNYNSTIDADANNASDGAIVLENTTYVISNTISDKGYIMGNCRVCFRMPWSFTPHNKFPHLRQYNKRDDHFLGDCWRENFRRGIQTESSIGYVKLNTISGCDYNYFSENFDKPKLILNTFTAPNMVGIELQAIQE